ncbi:hypothetical protein C0583_01320 [Candidatus Parcubacteria bacterium]|nr:MAG: hypothetical protein C0583_01320 [Candidatus Parcubacteria bacterium]
MTNNPFVIDLGSIGDAMKNMQNAYSEGLTAMNQSGEMQKEEINPSHKIIINTKSQAKVEGHDYLVDVGLEFLIDLDSILSAQGGDIASLLGGLGVDLSDEETGQVAEQLGKPRCVGYLDNFKINKAKLKSSKGDVEKVINKKGSILASLDAEKIRFSFESVFALPELQAKETVYMAIPDIQKMQENVVIDKNNLEKKHKFSWQEKDKDNLKISGDIQIKKI